MTRCPLLTVRRMGLRLRPGAITATVAAVALLGTALTDFQMLTAAAAAALGAALVDALRPLWSRIGFWQTAAVVVPLGVWAGQLTGLAISHGVGWPAELGAGVVVPTMLTGWTLAWISGPFARHTSHSLNPPPAATADQISCAPPS